ncbi:MAG: LysE family transporter [Acidobacteria bacterium]|nr:LysE family transporter [Acidobacteriota bacterium]
MPATDPSTLSVVVTGLLLGWSVAWPPGPINAEIVRRGLTRGFWPAAAIGFGACSGDFSWALAVSLGAGALADRPGVRPLLAGLSLVLLLFLAWTYLAGAVGSWRPIRGGEAPPPARALDSTRAGFFLGLGMALSSPWNLAFWLAVIGQQATTPLDFGRSLLLAVAVVAAAGLWTVFLAAAARLGARVATPSWDIGTRLATGLLMLFFAFRLALRIVGA